MNTITSFIKKYKLKRGFIMLKILNEVIENIREKEKNALIVLKGFDDEIFKEISKNIEPAFFPDFFLEQNYLQTLLENKKNYKNI